MRLYLVAAVLAASSPVPLEGAHSPQTALSRTSSCGAGQCRAHGDRSVFDDSDLDDLEQMMHSGAAAAGGSASGPGALSSMAANLQQRNLLHDLREKVQHNKAGATSASTSAARGEGRGSFLKTCSGGVKSCPRRTRKTCPQRLQQLPLVGGRIASAGAGAPGVEETEEDADVESFDDLQKSCSSRSAGSASGASPFKKKLSTRSGGGGGNYTGAPTLVFSRQHSERPSLLLDQMEMSAKNGRAARGVLFSPAVATVGQEPRNGTSITGTPLEVSSTTAGSSSNSNLSALDREELEWAAANAAPRWPVSLHFSSTTTDSNCSPLQDGGRRSKCFPSHAAGKYGARGGQQQFRCWPLSKLFPASMGGRGLRYAAVVKHAGKQGRGSTPLARRSSSASSGGSKKPSGALATRRPGRFGSRRTKGSAARVIGATAVCGLCVAGMVVPRKEGLLRDVFDMQKLRSALPELANHAGKTVREECNRLVDNVKTQISQQGQLLLGSRDEAGSKAEAFSTSAAPTQQLVDEAEDDQCCAAHDLPGGPHNSAFLLRMKQNRQKNGAQLTGAGEDAKVLRSPAPELGGEVCRPVQQEGQSFTSNISVRLAPAVCAFVLGGLTEQRMARRNQRRRALHYGSRAIATRMAQAGDDQSRAGEKKDDEPGDQEESQSNLSTLNKKRPSVRSRLGRSLRRLVGQYLRRTGTDSKNFMERDAASASPMETGASSPAEDLVGSDRGEDGCKVAYPQSKEDPEAVARYKAKKQKDEKSELPGSSSSSSGGTTSSSSNHAAQEQDFLSSYRGKSTNVGPWLDAHFGAVTSYSSAAAMDTGAQDYVLGGVDSFSPSTARTKGVAKQSSSSTQAATAPGPPTPSTSATTSASLASASSSALAGGTSTPGSNSSGSSSAMSAATDDETDPDPTGRSSGGISNYKATTSTPTSTSSEQVNYSDASSTTKMPERKAPVAKKPYQSSVSDKDIVETFMRMNEGKSSCKDGYCDLVQQEQQAAPEQQKRNDEKESIGQRIKEKVKEELGFAKTDLQQLLRGFVEGSGLDIAEETVKEIELEAETLKKAKQHFQQAEQAFGQGNPLGFLDQMGDMLALLGQVFEKVPATLGELKQEEQTIRDVLKNPMMFPTRTAERLFRNFGEIAEDWKSAFQAFRAKNYFECGKELGAIVKLVLEKKHDRSDPNHDLQQLLLFSPSKPSPQERAQLIKGLLEGMGFHTTDEFFVDTNTETQDLFNAVVVIARAISWRNVTLLGQGLEKLGKSLQNLPHLYYLLQKSEQETTQIEKSLQWLADDRRDPKEIAQKLSAHLYAQGDDVLKNMESSFDAWKSKDIYTFGLSLGKILADLVDEPEQPKPSSPDTVKPATPTGKN
ncbi:unnamed protein product [Amoebophrya sp. A120]|nr:unnamed protein product [Amoebophrya sp. A120]|eukprot:GSA120T00004382001.1